MRTDYQEKFGAPRQSSMVPEARGYLKLKPRPEFREALNHLDKFSHVWVVFEFNQSVEKGWRPTIEPPRVEAPRRVGVFASRSPHRPNPIGISALKLERIDFDAPGGIELHFSGVDILDNTPVLDIKPYLPFADSIVDATAGWASGEIQKYPVEFSDAALAAIEAAGDRAHPALRALIMQTLEWDPRPRSQREKMPIHDSANDGRTFAFRLLDFDVRWEIQCGAIRVLDLVTLNQ